MDWFVLITSIHKIQIMFTKKKGGGGGGVSHSMYISDSIKETW
jgi:hypothetical protein